MSKGFSIDGIEDVFREDVLRLIATLRRRLEYLCEHPDDEAAIEDVRATGHSLKGTASLVGLGELSHCGALVERMTEVAGTFARAQPDEARAVYQAMQQGLDIVERLLEQCLLRAPVPVLAQHFDQLRAVFPERFGSYLPSEPGAPPARPPLAAAPSEEDEFAKELAEVFALELQEQLQSVPREIRLLGAAATRAVAGNQLNRIFHTIKGSAAMVGLRDLSETARRLERFFAEPGNFASPAIIEAAQADMETIFRTAVAEAPQLATALAEAAKGAAEIDLERELLEAFTIDATEGIERSEQILLGLENQPDDRELQQALFRQFHTLKGAAGAVGLEAVAGQLHRGESLLESVIEGETRVDPGRFVDFLFRLTDSVIALINQARGVSDPRRRVMTDIEAAVAALQAPVVPVAAPRVTPTVAPAEAPAPAALAQEAEAGVVRVQAVRLDALLNQVGQLVVSRTRMDQKLASFTELRDKLEYCRTRLSDTIEGFQRRFEFTIGEPFPMPMRRGGDGESSPGVERTRAIGYGAGVDDFFTELEFDKYDDFNILARSVIELASDTGEVADQLGQFIEVLGEEVRQFSKIISGLQRQITNLRLVPLDVVFRRLQRPVRDSARQEEKQVEFVLQGGEVQLDRGVIEALYPPLLHLVRNAVSHGIETPAIRAERGKPPVGALRITAAARHNSVALAIEDDGAGLDFRRIRAKGEQLGLITPDSTPPREQLLSLIFRPGFSTQDDVTDLAGRGVGMDVVARQVTALNGSVVVDSKDGQGTTVRLALPITTSIDEVLILQSGAQRYALPVDFVDRVVPMNLANLEQEGTQLMLAVDDERIPTLLLGPLVNEPMVDNAVAILLRAGERAMALGVDAVHGQREVVIRPLNRVLAAHPFLSGATISGAGEVIFVLHAGRIFELLGFTADQLLEVQVTREEREQEESAEVGRAVLVVDDSISVRKLAARFLESEGLEVDTAVDGLDALDKLAQGRFRVVISDLEMPRMHGYDLIEAIKSNPKLAHLPIIVCTSRSSEKHRQRAMELGAEGYVTKPFSKEELLAEILRVTEWRAAMPADAAGTSA